MQRSLLLLVGAVVSSPLSGQVVTGRVLKASTDSTIEGVTLALASDSLAQAVATVTTGPGGAFSLGVPEPGIYMLKGTHLGYAVGWSAPFFVDRTDTMEIEFRMAEHAIPLEPLRVVARRPGGRARLERWGFYDRMVEYANLGRARFYTPEDLDASRAYKVTDLLRDVPRFDLVRSGRQIFIYRRGTRQRVPIFLDGHRLGLRRDESLDEMIAFGDVEALEIYWRWAPAQYGGGAAIVMWTGPR